MVNNMYRKIISLPEIRYQIGSACHRRLRHVRWCWVLSFCIALLVLQSAAASDPAGDRFLTYPFAWDENMRVVAGWEYDDGDQHAAVDFVKGQSRNPASWQRFDVLAAAAGEACWKYGGGNDPGRTVVITHNVGGTRYETDYVHLAAVEAEIPRCPERVPVARGMKIGVAGDRSWGDRCRPPCVHLHFALVRSGRPVDPYGIYGRSGRYPQPAARVQGLMGTEWYWTADPPVHPNEDEQPPSIHFVLPRLNVWYATDAQISWQVVDEGGSGVKGFNWAWDADPGGMPPAQRTDSATVALSEAGVGVHTICVRAWDGRGNEVFLSYGWFGYDPFPPTRPGDARELHGVVDGSAQSDIHDPQFEWDDALDMVSGIAGYHVYWGTNSIGTASNWTDAPVYDPGAVEPGTYFLRVQAQDVAGNVSSWETRFIFIYE